MSDGADDDRARLEQNLERLRVAMAALRTDVMAQMDRLENTVRAIREDLKAKRP